MTDALGIKVGMVFLHKHWKNPVFSLQELKELPPEATALPFKITKISRGVVYYRPIYMTGGQESLGSPVKASLGEFPQYVLRWVDRTERVSEEGT